MRSRSNSGQRLDNFHRIVEETILNHQDPVTGLLPASATNKHAWVRDNVYSIVAVWALSMAYKKMADADEDRAKTYELQQSCVKLMRGLLMSFMKQRDKLEKFKVTHSPSDALHAKYSSETGQTVVGDEEWGHLQIDAVSLYLLILAQMTASGLQIVFNTDEVTFIQNLVFYIESAYCIPDYGIWERGDKSNQGLPELNASSIGMAKAALEAMNELDLFGARGGQNSTIQVMADEAEKCQAVLQSMLPRESGSKEVDSGLLSVIGFPAFAVDDPDLIKLTRTTVVEKLQGRYGCKRFLRDGHKTAKEDPNRLYYEPWELRMFEHIECEWPLFFCYLMIDACFRGDREAVEEYSEALDEIMIRSSSGILLVPELYTVPGDRVAEEYKSPGSQDRLPIGRCPFMWAQSLYTVGKLLQEGFLAPGELDPLNRRLGSEKKPDVVVQVVILAEDENIQEMLRASEINVQTVMEVAPIEVQPARVMTKLFNYLGKNDKLGLSGRKSQDVGILSTSRLYTLHDRIFAFTPQMTDQERFYVVSDHDFMVDTLKNEISFLKSNWENTLGRPTVVLVVRNTMLEAGKIPMALVSTMKKLKSGYTTGTRVMLGNLSDFLHTSCITSLNFLSSEDSTSEKLDPEIQEFLEQHLERSLYLPRLFRPSNAGSVGTKLARRPAAFDPQRRMSHHGSIRRSRSIAVNERSLGLSTDSKVCLPSQYPKSPPPTTTKAPPIPSVSSRPPLGAIKEGPHSPPPIRGSPGISSAFNGADLEEMLAILKETDNLDEKGDILHLLFSNHGLDFNTGFGEDGRGTTVKDHLKSLYETACQEKRWGLVRHSAGMLGKRVEDLAKAVCDILVRQKQVTFGMPPHHEMAITAPLPEAELRATICATHGSDRSTAMLTQELIVYLGMFIRTEPHLFNEMLRLRVGLIIQVMVSELARALDCSTNEASEHLINFSPFEMKNLLLVIISGKEFGIRASQQNLNFSVVLSKRTMVSKSKVGLPQAATASHGLTAQQKREVLMIGPADEEKDSAERQGQWLRRRKLDGALNRAPKNFYPRVWALLERSQGLIIADKVLPQSLTQEMTSGELKFALQVEVVLNSIPQPEYRQLIVEALMVLTLIPEFNLCNQIPAMVEVEHIVHRANQIFLDDQITVSGDATLCCARPKGEKVTSATGELPCKGPAFICLHFYDSAPSGNFGTMTYLMRSAALILNCFPQEGFECKVS